GGGQPPPDELPVRRGSDHDGGAAAGQRAEQGFAGGGRELAVVPVEQHRMGAVVAARIAPWSHGFPPDGATSSTLWAKRYRAVTGRPPAGKPEAGPGRPLVGGRPWPAQDLAVSRSMGQWVQ